MKVSSVAISASALALTASAAIVPLHSTINMKVGSSHNDYHDRNHHPSKASIIQADVASGTLTKKYRKKETRRSRIRSAVYLDSHRHGHDVLVDTFHGHRHDGFEIPMHHHDVEYVTNGHIHRDHKRSTYYSYLPSMSYSSVVHEAPVVTRVRGSHPRVTVIDHYIPAAPGRVNIHEHIHHRRKNQHGSPKSSSPKRFSIKHGKPSKGNSKSRHTQAPDSQAHQEKKHAAHSSDSATMSKTKTHRGKTPAKSRKSKHLSERSTPAETPVTQSGVPGFVEVATPVFRSTLAKTVSGLAYTTDPTTNGTGFNLGTSDSQSSQFFMSPMNGTGGAIVYQLRIPVLDSSSFTTVDHCVTFAISPPGPLSLEKCGPVLGCSQIFSYDSSSGKLQPIYGLGQVTPLNSTTSDVSNSTLLSSSGVPALGTLRQTKAGAPSNGPHASATNTTTSSNATTSSNSTSSNMTTSSDYKSPNVTASSDPSFMAAHQDIINGSNSSTDPQNVSSSDHTRSRPQRLLAQPESASINSTTSSLQEPPPAPVALYFVPAQGFYQAPATIDQVLDSTALSASNASSIAASPNPKLRNVVSSSEDGSDDDGMDADDNHGGVNRAVIDPITNTAAAAGVPVPSTPQNHSGVNTDQVLGDSGDVASDLSETQNEVKSDEAEDAALVVPGGQ